MVTYNIHKGRGMDRRNRIQRVAEILQGLKPDIVALQEVLSVEGKEPEAHQARFIAEALGFHFRIGETRRLRGGAYGNVTLSRFPVVFEKHYDLSQPGGRPGAACGPTSSLNPIVSCMSIISIWGRLFGSAGCRPENYLTRRF